VRRTNPRRPSGRSTIVGAVFTLVVTAGILGFVLPAAHRLATDPGGVEAVHATVWTGVMFDVALLLVGVAAVLVVARAVGPARCIELVTGAVQRLAAVAKGTGRVLDAVLDVVARALLAVGGAVRSRADRGRYGWLPGIYRGVDRERVAGDPAECDVEWCDEVGPGTRVETYRDVAVAGVRVASLDDVEPSRYCPFHSPRSVWPTDHVAAYDRDGGSYPTESTDGPCGVTPEAGMPDAGGGDGG
jgi:hypothetical protein